MKLFLPDLSAIRLLIKTSPLLIALITGSLYAQQPKSNTPFADHTPSLPLLDLQDIGYGVGNINGTKLKVPNNYLMSGISYQGEDIWSGKKRDFTPSYNSLIDNFTIIIKLKDYQPAKSKAEWARYLAFTYDEDTSLDNTWLWVTVSPDQSLSSAIKDTSLKIASVFERWKNSGLDGKPYVRQKTKQYGLARYICGNERG